MSTDNTPVQNPAVELELLVTNPDKVYRLINDHTNKLDLPVSVTETVTDLFRRAYQEMSLSARGTEIAVAAVTKIACRLHGIARSLGEIAAVSGSDAKLIDREARKIESVTGEYTTPVPVRVYAEHWGDKLGLDQAPQREAIALLGNTNPGRAPAAAAAGALWTVLASQDDRDVTQHDIVEATYTSAYTLREVQSDINSG